MLLSSGLAVLFAVSNILGELHLANYTHVALHALRKGLASLDSS
jgi:hypothetical protein